MQMEKIRVPERKNQCDYARYQVDDDILRVQLTSLLHPNPDAEKAAVGAGQGQGGTRAGDLKASLQNRNRGIQGSLEGAPAGDLNASHLNRSISLKREVRKRRPKFESQTLHLNRNKGLKRAVWN
jgi:hypothetical protein